MSQIDVFNPDRITVNIVHGKPPVDQSSEVAALKAALEAMTAERDLLAERIVKAKIESDQALVEAQQARDALG